MHQVLCGHIKAPKWHLKGLLATQSDMPSLFIPFAAMGKCKQINNSNLPYLSGSWYIYFYAVLDFECP